MRILIALAMLCGGLVMALAAPKRAAADVEKQTLESFAAANAGCREWSDGCMVCTRGADATFACSLPGIACQPAKVACSGLDAPSPAK